MSDSTKRWTISFNGEIYNYQELRKELEMSGVRFVTLSDTEVLINVVAEWGEQGLRRLRGMFAFALWDKKNNELWLGRDPFGIKPLYYAQTGHEIWFASQARAIAECVLMNATQSAAGLVGFYLWGSVPDPFTWWQGINALPAGHILRIKAGNKVGYPKPFTLVSDFYHAPAEPITAQELRDEFAKSVAAHFISDVPVGIFMSAGIDSTAIAIVAKELGYQFKSITLSFDEYLNTSDDEALVAESTARLLGVDHRTVRMGRDEFYAAFDDFFMSMDQPSIDGLNSYLVSRAAAANGIKVALSGLGGDELFGGYPSFRQVPWLTAVGRRIPGRKILGGLLARIGLPIARLLNSTPKLAASIKYSGSIEAAYFLRRCLYLPEDLEMLVDVSWSKRGLEELSCALPGGEPDRIKRLAALNEYASVSQLEITQYMNYQLLRTADWASMAHSVEVRVPFVDVPLFRKLSPSIVSKNPPNKLYFARSIGPLLEKIAMRPKTGFTTPVSQWLLEKSGRSRGLQQWTDVVATSFRVSLASTE